MVTWPDNSFTRQVPQVPTRQELSISTPISSATSRITLSGGNGADLSDTEKVTVGREISLPSKGAVGTVGRIGSGLPKAGPNASVFIRPLGTPSPNNIFFATSIIGTGPQMCTSRDATSGTVWTISSLVRRPIGPFQSGHSGRETVMRTRKFGFR